MDYSSQDSNPLDFSRNNKDLLHQHLINQGMMSLADDSMRHSTAIVVSTQNAHINTPLYRSPRNTIIITRVRCLCT